MTAAIEDDDHVIMAKNSSGHLVPVDDEQAEKIKHVKVGQWIRVKVVRIRNYLFLQKYMVLVKYLYDIWEDGLHRLRYKGQDVMPNKERFRKDLQILAGFYDVTYKYDGTLILTSKSVSFASMGEEEFSRVFNEMINVGLRHMLSNRPDLTPEKIRAICEQIINFDRN